MRKVATSLLYTALALGAGMVLGPIRELYVRPRIGNDLAILLETPLIVAASVLAWRIALRRFPVGSAMGERLAVGALSLALLLIAEAVLSEVLRGRSLISQWSRYGLLAQAANLFGLVAFFAIPALLRGNGAAKTGVRESQ